MGIPRINNCYIILICDMTQYLTAIKKLHLTEGRDSLPLLHGHLGPPTTWDHHYMDLFKLVHLPPTPHPRVPRDRKIYVVKFWTHPQPNFPHFHAVFRRIWSNNRLAPPWIWRPPWEILDPSLHTNMTENISIPQTTYADCN